MALLKQQADGKFVKIPEGEPVAFEQAPLYSIFNVKMQENLAFIQIPLDFV